MHNMLQHNGVVELLNRCLVERVRAILHQSGLLKNLWGEATHFCIWLKNWTSTRAIGRVTTPFERLTGRKPNLAGMLEWGQHVWVHSSSRSKLDTWASVARWVGFDQDSPHAHHIYWPEKGSVLVEQDVKFASDQAVVYAPHFPSIQSEPPAVALPSSVPAPAAPMQPSAVPSAPSQPQGSQSAWLPRTPVDSSDEDDNQVESELSDLTDLSTEGPSTPVPRRRKGKPTKAAQPTRQSTQACKPSAHVRRLATGEGTVDGISKGFPGWHPDYVGHSVTKSATLIESLAGPNFGDSAFLMDLDSVIVAAIKESEDKPKTIAEAWSHPNWPRWKEAMDRKIKMLKGTGT
jgi:hypothetical protein